MLRITCFIDSNYFIESNDYKIKLKTFFMKLYIKEIFDFIDDMEFDLDYKDRLYINNDYYKWVKTNLSFEWFQPHFEIIKYYDKSYLLFNLALEPSINLNKDICKDIEKVMILLYQEFNSSVFFYDDENDYYYIENNMVVDNLIFSIISKNLFTLIVQDGIKEYNFKEFKNYNKLFKNEWYNK